jgi:hypothetical protein
MNIYQSEPAVIVADPSAETPLTDKVSTDEQPASPPFAGSVTKTPSQWAEVFYPAHGPKRLHDDAWKHAAAASLHGWWQCLRVSGAEMQLSREDYEAAITAASGSTFKPHADACFRPEGAR